MTRTLLIIPLLFLAGCGQTPAVPVQVVNPPVVKPAASLPADTTILASWPEANRSLYETAKAEVRDKLLEFPLEPAEWITPVFVAVEDGKAPSPPGMTLTNVRFVGGVVIAPNDAGVKLKRDWRAGFADVDGKGPVLVSIDLGGKGKNFLSPSRQ